MIRSAWPSSSLLDNCTNWLTHLFMMWLNSMTSHLLVFQKLKILSMDERGKDIEYKAAFTIYPKPWVLSTQSFEVTAERPSVTDKEVSDVVDNVLRSCANIHSCQAWCCSRRWCCWCRDKDRCWRRRWRPFWASTLQAWRKETARRSLKMAFLGWKLGD